MAGRLAREVLDELGRLVPDSLLLQDESMSSHTSFKIGGPADLLVLPSGIADLKRVVQFCIRTGTPWFVMGNGTNLLVRDKGIRGVVIKMAGTLNHINLEGDRIAAGAGALLRDVSVFAAQHGLSGLEFACGIPGTMGGAVVMNAGAYGGEMKDVVESVRLLSPGGEIRSVPASAMEFGYRKSVLQDSGDIALEATLTLRRDDKGRIEATMRDFEEKRKAKQPLDVPSAGSVFRRPEGHFVGPLVEGAGLKGFRVGDAGVSGLHAGFIVNHGHATAGDVLLLIGHIQDTVFRRYGVRLEPEIKVVGEA
ncbi:MAG: UDP-N-acetylmuramate dehydrogenase [Ignavibacteriales bacterium]